MYINNFEAHGEVSGYNPSQPSNHSRGILSGSFFEALEKKMVYYLKAVADGAVNEAEYAFIANGQTSNEGWAAVESLTAEGRGGNRVYDGATATLWATLGINNISVTMNFGFNLISQQKDLFDKASALMAG